MKTPWFHILTSPPVWGVMVAYFCTNWSFYTLLTCMPTFIKQTLGCSNNIVSFESQLVSLKAKFCKGIPKTELCKFCDFCCPQPIVLNGVYSAIPYFFLAVFTILAGPLADYMRNHWFSTTFTRKLFTDIGLLSSV